MTVRGKGSKQDVTASSKRNITIGLLVLILLLVVYALDPWHMREQPPDPVRSTARGHDSIFAKGADNSAMNLMQKGVFTDDVKEAQRIFAEVISNYDTQDDEVSRYAVAVSMVNYSVICEDTNEKIRMLDTVIERYKSTVSKDARLSYHVAKAMNMRSELCKNPSDGELLSDEVILLYKESTHPLTQAAVMEAYYHKARAAHDAIDREELLDTALSLYECNNTLQLHKVRAQCLILKGQRGRYMEDRVAAFDEVINTYGATTDMFLQQHVALAMSEKLAVPNSSEVKFALYQQFFDAYGNSSIDYIKRRIRTAIQDFVSYAEHRREEKEAITSMLATLKNSGHDDTIIAALEGRAKKAYAREHKKWFLDAIFQTYRDSDDEKTRQHLIRIQKDYAEVLDDLLWARARYQESLREGPEFRRLWSKDEFYTALLAEAEAVEDRDAKLRLYDEALTDNLRNPGPGRSTIVEEIINKKAALLGDKSIEIQYYDTIILNAESDASVRSALLAKSKLVTDDKEKRTVNEEFIKRFKNSTDWWILQDVGNFYRSQLRLTKEMEKKRRIYDEMIEVFATQVDSNLARYYGDALLGRVATASDEEDKIRQLEYIIAVLKDKPQRELRECRNKAIIIKARLTGDIESAAHELTRIAAMADNDTDYAKALLSKVEITEDIAEKIQIYDEILGSLDYPTLNSMENVTFQTYRAKAELLSEPEAKKAIYRSIIQRVKGNSEFKQRSYLHYAYTELDKLTENRNDKIRLYDEFAAHLSLDSDDLFWWNMAMKSKTRIVEAPAEKTAIYDRIIEEGVKSSSTLKSMVIGEALVAKAELTDDHIHKITVYDEFIGKYGNTDDIRLSLAVDTAIGKKAQLIGDKSIIVQYFDHKISQTIDREIIKWINSRKEIEIISFEKKVGDIPFLPPSH